MDVNQDSAEYKKVVADFMRTLGGNNVEIRQVGIYYLWCNGSGHLKITISKFDL